MNKTINGNLIIHGKLILEKGSKVFATGRMMVGATAFGFTDAELLAMNGEHIQGNLILCKDNYYVDGDVYTLTGADLHGAGCAMVPVENLADYIEVHKYENPTDPDVWPDVQGCDHNCCACMAKCMYRKAEYKEETE